MKAEKHGDDNKEGNIDQQKQSTKDENNWEGGSFIDDPWYFRNTEGNLTGQYEN